MLHYGMGQLHPCLHHFRNKKNLLALPLGVQTALSKESKQRMLPVAAMNMFVQSAQNPLAMQIMLRASTEEEQACPSRDS